MISLSFANHPKSSFADYHSDVLCLHNFQHPCYLQRHGVREEFIKEGKRRVSRRTWGRFADAAGGSGDWIPWAFRYSSVCMWVHTCMAWSASCPPNHSLLLVGVRFEFRRSAGRCTRSMQNTSEAAIQEAIISNPQPNATGSDVFKSMPEFLRAVEGVPIPVDKT